MGFEPTTSAVTGRRSNQLSHRAIMNAIISLMMYLQNCTQSILFEFLSDLFTLLKPDPLVQPSTD